VANILASGLARPLRQGVCSKCRISSFFAIFADGTRITCSKFKDPNLLVYIGGDAGDVYEDSFMRVSGGPEDFKPTLVLLGIRLGIEKVTPVYHEALKVCTSTIGYM
jgi:hypothetical protein